MSYDPAARGARCDVCPLRQDGELRRAMSENPARPDPFRPVPPEIHPRRGTNAPDHADIALVGQMPGHDEEREGYPFAGNAGVELTKDLVLAGLRRHDVDLHNLLACCPPGPASGAWQRMDATLRRLNAEREAVGIDPLPHPASCCRPRLDAELAPYRTILTLGGEAHRALTGDTRPITTVHGEILGRDTTDQPWRAYDPSSGAVLPHLRMVPTVHPAFVLRSPAWRDTLVRELAKARRVANGVLNWPEPEVVYQPTPEELEAWLSTPAPFSSFDVETDAREPLEARIRCFAFAVPDLDEHGKAIDTGERKPFRVARAVGVNLLSGDGHTRFYPEEAEQRIIRIVTSHLANPMNLVFGANLLGYDSVVVTQNWYGGLDAFSRATHPPIANGACLLLASRFRAPDIPKGLKPNGRLFTDVGRWESDEKGEDHAVATGRTVEDAGAKDAARVIYNVTDTVVGCRVTVPLIRGARANGAFDPCNPVLKPSNWPDHEPFDLWSVDHACQRMCIEMHQLGVWVDQAARSRLHREYAVRAGKRLALIQDLLGAIPWVRPPPSSLLSGFNPNSADQFRDLLYEYLALGQPPGIRAEEFITETGLPSTGGRVLRAHLARKDVDTSIKRLVLNMMLYRRETTKVLGTTLGPLDPAAENTVVARDGRVRSTWNAHVVPHGRLSSQNPNMQNAARKAGLKRLRAVFAAAPGHVLIAGDLKQAHGRIIANHWDVPSLRAAYLQKRDPYMMVAVAIFGRDDLLRGGWSGDLCGKPPDGSPAATLRQAAKTYLLAGLYAASSDTKQIVIAGTEEEILGADGRPTGDTEFPYLGIDALMVGAWDERWHADEPGWKRAWASAEMRWRANGGWLREPVLGRRSGSLNDGELNDVCNYEILAAEAGIMRLVEARVLDAFPFECDGPGTGMIAQTHDGIVVEIMDRGLGENERRRKLLEACMSIERLAMPGWEVPIEAETTGGASWADLG